MIEKGQLVDFMYYKKIPQQYVTEDTKLKKPLYRYLQSAFAGSDYLLDYINGMLMLVDPNNVDDKYLPYFLKCFGFKYFEDIDPKYQKKILANVGILRKRRGTHSLAKFLVRVLTDMDVSVEYDPDTRYLTITLKPSTINDILNMDTSRKVITRYIQDFIPYYCRIRYQITVKPQEIDNLTYLGQFITLDMTYNIIPPAILETQGKPKVITYLGQAISQETVYNIIPPKKEGI